MMMMSSLVVVVVVVVVVVYLSKYTSPLSSVFYVVRLLL
jgi:hypothetical protein